jgi:hypothetical protein
MNVLFAEVNKRMKRLEEENKSLKKLIRPTTQIINGGQTINNIQNHFNTTLNFNIINFGEGGRLMKEILAKDGAELLEQKFTEDIPRYQQVTDRVVDLVGLVYRNPEYKEMQGIYVLDLSKEKNNAYYHEDGKWKVSDWVPLRRQLLCDLSFQLSTIKGMKQKDAENMIHLIFSLGADTKGDILGRVGDLLKFDSIVH